MSKIRFPVALLAAAILGWVIGQAHAEIDPRRFQAAILLMPKTEEGIVTGVVKKFHTIEDCQEWLGVEMAKLIKTQMELGSFSNVVPVGRCHGR